MAHVSFKRLVDGPIKRMATSRGATCWSLTTRYKTKWPLPV